MRANSLHHHLREDRQDLFPLGVVVATPAVIFHFEQHGINAQDYIERHVRGDYGNIPSEDWTENVYSVKHGHRILSSYTVADEVIWIITEADRSSTCILFPSEY